MYYSEFWQTSHFLCVCVCVCAQVWGQGYKCVCVCGHPSFLTRKDQHWCGGILASVAPTLPGAEPRFGRPPPAPLAFWLQMSRRPHVQAGLSWCQGMRSWTHSRNTGGDGEPRKRKLQKTTENEKHTTFQSCPRFYRSRSFSKESSGRCGRCWSWNPINTSEG